MKNKELEKYVNGLKILDLNQVKQITIKGKDILGNIICEDLEDLLLFHNLENCMIKDYTIDDDAIKVINRMKNLTTLHFDNCDFVEKENLDFTGSTLIFTFCLKIKLNKINGTNLKIIRIDNCKKVDLRKLKRMDRLKKLEIKNCGIKHIKEVNKFENLELLNINGSKLINTREIKDIDSKIEIKYESKNRLIL